MRIFFSVAVGMMHAVHDTVCTWIQERGPLCNKGKKVKESFPGFAHREHFMRHVAVQEKRLTEQGKEPVRKKKNQDDHTASKLFKNT